MRDVVGDEGAGADDRFAMRYWEPDPALRPYLFGYHVYEVMLPPGERMHDVFFPAWSNIRFTIEGEPWSIRIGRRSFDPVPAAALFGPTSEAGYTSFGRGTMIGAAITPRGWARFFGRDASLHADRVTPFDRLLGEEATGLWLRLRAGAPPREVFDAWFLDRLAKTAPEPPEIASLFDAVNDPAVGTAAAAAERSGLGGRALGRLSRGAFGFTPKLLLRRARFLRALMGALAMERGHWSDALAPAGYYDQSHFLRDCRLFLGMPLGAFVAFPKPVAEVSMRLRTQRLGAPTQALHGPARAMAAEAEEGLRAEVLLPPPAS